MGWISSSDEGAENMIAAWCFQCRFDYAADVAECVQCRVPTVDYVPSTPDQVSTDNQSRIAYDLHGWDSEARAEVENRLHIASIAHAWEGPILMIIEADEFAVDAFMEEIDQGEKVGDSIEDGQEEEGSSIFLDEETGEVASHEVVEKLFLAADRLRRNTRDLRAQRNLLDAESLARDLKLPFGYEAPMWRSVLEQSAVLVALIEDLADDHFVEAQASSLRATLHPYV